MCIRDSVKTLKTTDSALMYLGQNVWYLNAVGLKEGLNHVMVLNLSYDNFDMHFCLPVT